MHVLQHHMPLEDIHHVLVTHSHIDHLYPSDLINLAEPYAPRCDGTDDYLQHAGGPGEKIPPRFKSRGMTRIICQRE